MANNKKPKTVGAYAPQKEPIFSINATESGMRIRIVSNALPQQLRQESLIRRVRVD
jgi:hypothetical protein